MITVTCTTKLTFKPEVWDKLLYDSGMEESDLDPTIFFFQDDVGQFFFERGSLEISDLKIENSAKDELMEIYKRLKDEP